MPPEGVELSPHNEILRLEETLRICAAAAGLGISKIKVTGGEPLVRLGVGAFIRSLKHCAGIKTVTLTTNGIALGNFLDELPGAGLDAVNVSLDTLDKAKFRRITRFDKFEQVICSIKAAQKTRLAVKINCVPIRGINENEIIELANFAGQNKITIRFIELMPLGLGAGLSPVPQAEIFEKLRREFGDLTPSAGQEGNGPAIYYNAAGFAGKIGFISALSHNFCGACNRVRLTVSGFLKPCLSSDIGCDLKAVMRGGGDDKAIADAIRAAIMLKPVRHDFCENSSRHKQENMFRIGG
jgi:cyclic pyranopterin phosphate synthase